MVKLAIDIDGTINACQQSIEWFKLLTSLLIAEHKIYIITNREPGSEHEIEKELAGMGIQYSEIVITAEKADFITKEGITVFVDNQTENFIDLGEEVLVFLIREAGNFSFPEKKWIMDSRSATMID